MPYVNADGSVSQSRTRWRFSIITDFLWAVVNTVGLFFSTLLNPTAAVPQIRRGPESGRSSSASSGGGGGGEGVNRRGAYQSFRRGDNIKTLPKQCTSNK